MKKYKVTLTAEEREQLQGLIAAGKAAARKLTHARILLKADAAAGGPAWTDERIAEAVEVSVATVERLRQRFVERGLEATLGRKQPSRPSRERKLDGRAEARLLALACSAPPEGRQGWTLRLLADRLVELDIVDTICHETVRRVLKKTRPAKLTGAGDPPVGVGMRLDRGGSDCVARDAGDGVRAAGATPDAGRGQP